MTAALAYPDEVVTSAYVRYLAVPGLEGGLALITIDNGLDHTRPTTFGPAGLANLAAALDQIEARSPAPSAIAVTGKPFIFAVGADLSGIALIDTLDKAHEIGRLGHEVFARLKNSTIPTFAFITARPWAAGSSLLCTATTGPCVPAPRPLRCRSASSALCPAGAELSCCPT